MAKVTMPLMGTRASGKLADSIVYMHWKGIETVRQYVIPTNPKTPAQIHQRIIRFKAAVDMWHSFSLIEGDATAWRMLASTLVSKIHPSFIGCMTAFNALVRFFVDGLVADSAAVWNEISKVYVTNNHAATFETTLTECTQADTIKMYHGTSKTYMPNETVEEAGGADDLVIFKPAGLVAGVKYYYYFKSTAAHRMARTGIYSYTPVA